MYNYGISGAAAFLAAFLIFVITFSMGVATGRKFEVGSGAMIGVSILAFIVFLIVVFILSALCCC